MRQVSCLIHWLSGVSLIHGVKIYGLNLVDLAVTVDWRVDQDVVEEQGLHRRDACLGAIHCLQQGISGCSLPVGCAGRSYLGCGLRLAGILPVQVDGRKATGSLVDSPEPLTIHSGGGRVSCTV